MVSLVEQSLRNGKPGIVRIGALDDSGNVIASPKVWFRGKLDGAQVDETDLDVIIEDLRNGRQPSRKAAETGPDGHIPPHGTLALQRQHIPADRAAGNADPDSAPAPAWLEQP